MSELQPLIDPCKDTVCGKACNICEYRGLQEVYQARLDERNRIVGWLDAPCDTHPVHVKNRGECYQCRWLLSQTLKGGSDAVK